MGSNRVQVYVRTAIAAVIAVPFLLPFLMLISTTLRTEDDFIRSPGGLPRSFTLEHLRVGWEEAHLAGGLRATFITCVVACLVCASTALAGAYWFRTHQGRVVAGTRWTLASVYAVPLIAWLIPVFVMLSQFELTNSLLVLGVIDGVSSLPFAFYLIHTFMQQTLTTEMLEAAVLDGAGTLRTFMRIAVPLALPALASVVALVFVWTFGELIVAATLLQDPSVQTVTLGIAGLSTRENVNPQIQAAASLVTLLPVLAVFIVAQKALRRGFAEGSGK
ncbi:carbohydrate ABC transporter permease [Kribbella sp. NPDC050124]|uniref:carbohydrate ABC transporter permease n=1 Tax=Kribbella sp. NPDC050124 TaxID=3364114 RepID=UPI0037A248C6